jgi:hypothetical protein
MSQENYRRGSLRYSRHTCDACGFVEKVKGVVLPPGWLDLGGVGIDGMAICQKCRASLGEAIAGWVLARRKGCLPVMLSSHAAGEPDPQPAEDQPSA